MRKRNVSRRQFLQFAGGAAGMAALAACVAPASGPADTGATTDEAAATPTPGRMAAEDRSVQLELYSVWGGLLFNEWINAVEVYEEANPDVGVTVTFAPGHGDNPKLLTAVAGGIPPDMAMIVDFSTAQWAELGVMSDLTTLLRRRRTLRRRLLARRLVPDAVQGQSLADALRRRPQLPALLEQGHL